VVSVSSLCLQSRDTAKLAPDLGKVGYHLQHALITYNGKEHQVRLSIKSESSLAERHYYDAFQINHYEILVCASQLRWGLASYESAGCLNQGTVILAQQNQQSQHGTAVWAAQRGQGGLNSQARIGSGLNTQAGYSGGYSTQTSYSGVQEVTTSTHSSFATSGFIGTTLFTTDIPRFIPNMMPTAPAPMTVAVAEEGLKKKLAYAFFIVKPVFTHLTILDSNYKTVILIDDSISVCVHFLDIAL